MTTYFRFLDAVWLLLVIFRPVSSTSAGAPPSACIEMTPSHSGVPPNTTPCPFKLTANVPCFQPGQRVMLLLQDPLGQQFKGLMVQARLNAQPQSVGKFDLNDNKDLKFLNCFGSDSGTITQSDPNLKQSKEFGWTAPDVFLSGKVDFTYTVVQSYTNFWANNVFSLPLCAPDVDFPELTSPTSDNPISQTSPADDQSHPSTYTKNDETVGPVVTTDVAKEDTVTSQNPPIEVSSAPSMTNGTEGTESVPTDSSATSFYDKSFSSTVTMTATESNDVTTGGFYNTDQDFHSPFTNSSFSEAITNPVLTTSEIAVNTSNAIDPSQTNQDFSETEVTSSILDTTESNPYYSNITGLVQTDQYSDQFSNTDSSPTITGLIQTDLYSDQSSNTDSSSTTTGLVQTDQYSDQSSNTDSSHTITGLVQTDLYSSQFSNSSSEPETISTLQTMEIEQTDSTAELSPTEQQFSEVAATLPSDLNSTPTPGLSSFLSLIVSTTTTSLQVGPCVDSGPECKTLNMNKCYNHVIKTRCCLSCTKLQSSNPEGCEYGDKISICGFFRHPKFCQYYKDECCATCRDVV